MLFILEPIFASSPPTFSNFIGAITLTALASSLIGIPLRFLFPKLFQIFFNGGHSDQQSVFFRILLLKQIY